jgi:hypothetical protein
MKTKPILNTLVVAFLFAGIVACKKKIVEIPPSNEPTYSAKGFIGEDNFDFYVGDDESIYNYENTISNSVTIYQGKLLRGEQELQISLYSGDVDKHISNDVASLLSGNKILLASNSAEGFFKCTKDDFPNSSLIKEISWKVDGEYAGSNSLEILTPGVYQVCARIYYVSNGFTEVCNEVIVGFRKNASFLLDYSISGENFNTWINCTSTSVSSVKWYVNDSLMSQDLSFGGFLPENLNTIKAEIVFANGVKRTRSIFLNKTENGKSIFDFANLENNFNAIWDHKLKINYRNGAKEYSSVNLLNENASFVLSSVRFLGPDGNGNNVYIFKGKLIAQLKSKSNSEMVDLDLDISFGLSLK